MILKKSRVARLWRSAFANGIKAMTKPVEWPQTPCNPLMNRLRGWKLGCSLDVLVVAHRGSSSRAPENTIEAIIAAVEDDADWIELDVRRSADGKLVVIHDPLVDRTTDGIGQVATMTVDELQRLDAGYRFSPDGTTFPFRGQGVFIPTLEQVLRLFPTRKFLVELKESDKAAALRLLELLDKHDAFERVVVELISVKQQFARWLRRLEPRLITSHTSIEIAAFLLLSRLRLGQFFQVQGVSFEVPRKRKYGWRIATPSFVRQATKKGLAVFVWTVNDPDEMRKFASLAVSGIMTDDPALLRRQLRRLS